MKEHLDSSFVEESNHVAGLIRKELLRKQIDPQIASFGCLIAFSDLILDIYFRGEMTKEDVIGMFKKIQDDIFLHVEKIDRIKKS